MVSQFSVDDSQPIDGLQDSCAGSTPAAIDPDNHRLLDLQRIFDLSQDFMCITDAQARFLRLSASAGPILGYQPHEFIGRKFLDFVHPGGVGAAISPSLPSRFLTIIQDTVRSAAGRACAAALRSAHTVICSNIDTDPEWRNLHELAASMGLPAHCSRNARSLGGTLNHRRRSCEFPVLRSHRKRCLQAPNGKVTATLQSHLLPHPATGSECCALPTSKQRISQNDARVRKRAQELQDSNRELEAFSYSVPHDLGGPLRAIAGFTGLLRDRHYDTIDADGAAASITYWRVRKECRT